MGCSRVLCRRLSSSFAWVVVLSSGRLIVVVDLNESYKDRGRTGARASKHGPRWSVSMSVSIPL